MAKRPTETPRLRRTQTGRPPITLELAASVCPDAQIAANIARHFALELVDYDAVREAHEEAVGNMAKAFDTTLNEKATAMHFQRVVGSLVTSAFGAGGFFGQKVSEARDLSAKSANEHRDEDRDGVYGFDSKAQRAQRARQFAAEMGLQAFAMLPTASSWASRTAS